MNLTCLVWECASLLIWTMCYLHCLAGRFGLTPAAQHVIGSSPPAAPAQRCGAHPWPVWHLCVVLGSSGACAFPDARTHTRT